MKKLLQAIGKAFNLTVVTNDEYNKLTTTSTPTVNEPTKPTTLLDYNQIVAMLKEYDDKKLIFDTENNNVSMSAMEYEDARISTFDLSEIKNYINYIEKTATEKGIVLKSISFIKGMYNKETAYNKKFIGYENLIYLPTAIVNGEETPIELTFSSKENIVSFKEVLANYGYDWRYSRTLKTIQTNIAKKEASNIMQFKTTDTTSSAGNRNNMAPPHDDQ